MAVIYQLYQDNREKSLTRGKWYARAKVQQTFDLDKLVEHMSNHDCPFSPGTIHGVLKDAIRCIRELTLDGNQVKLDELAMFSIGLETKPANSAKEYGLEEHRRLPTPRPRHRRVHQEGTRPLGKGKGGQRVQRGQGRGWQRRAVNSAP